MKYIDGNTLEAVSCYAENVGYENVGLEVDGDSVVIAVECEDQEEKNRMEWRVESYIDVAVRFEVGE